MEKDKFLQEIEERIEALDFIKPGMFPKIDLYMDQVTTFMDSHMKNSKRNEDDKILTKEPGALRSTDPRWYHYPPGTYRRDEDR